ncbi:YkvA family protein [Bacteroidota bacterium]
MKIRKDVKDWVNDNLDKENKWADYILAAPDLFHLLCKLTTDRDIPSNKKIKLVAGIAYFISPIDLLPEMFLGPVGYLDDIAVAAYILNDLINEVDPQIVKKHWAGEQDVLVLIKTILANADKMIGRKMWQRIRKRF